MSCCTSILDLGCFDSCQDIETGLSATQTGVHTITINDSAIVEFSQTSGQQIIIPGGYFNEDGTTTFKIIQPDDTPFESGENDCFKVLIGINYAQEASPSTSTVNVNGELLSTVLCGGIKNVIVKYEDGTIVPTTIIDNSTVEVPNAGVCDCDYEIEIQGIPTGQSVNLVNCEDLEININ